MKKIIYGLIIAAWGVSCPPAANAQDIQINIFASGTVVVGQQTHIEVQICNLSTTTTLAANKVRPVISTGSSAIQIVGYTNADGSPANNWTPLTQTGQNLRLQYNQPLPPSTCVTYYVIVQGISPSMGATAAGEPFAGQLFWNGPQPGGNNIGNDGSTTTVQVVANPVPVILLSFTAAKANTAVSLNWSISAEINASRYEVQRSANARDFTTLGHVDAAGSTAYNYMDNAPLQGVNFYRLRLVDNDGRFTYSDVRKITFSASQAAIFGIYPNPLVRSTLTMHVEQAGYEGRAVAVITDVAGRRVLQAEVRLIRGSQDIPVEAGSLAKGTYFISLYDIGGNAVTAAKKLVRQ